MRPRCDRYRDLVGFVCMLVLAVVALAALAASAGAGQAVCRTCVQKAVVYKQPVVVQPQYYAVGQALQQKATATHDFRQSEEFGEYLQLRGYKLAMEQVLAAGGGIRQLPGPAETVPVPENATPQPLPTAPPAAPENRYPVLTANCAKCHGGDDPKGAVWLDGSVDLNGPDAADVRDRIVRVLWLGHMPPSAPASDEVVGQILSELYRD